MTQSRQTSVGEWIDYDHADFSFNLGETGLPSEYLNTKRKETDMAEEFYNKKLSSLFGWAREKIEGEVGLEVEVEGKNLVSSLFNYWTTHTDQSLRNVDSHPPIEYVLKRPVSRHEVGKVLNYLAGHLKSSNSEVVDSTRTSVHVHLNVRDYSMRQLYCFIILYMIFEEVLVDWCGADRVGNLFCLRAKDSDYFLEMLIEPLKSGDVRTWREELRYTACNLSSVRKFGSLEFRSLRGTVDPTIIQNWVRILLKIKDKASDFDNAIEIIEDFVRVGNPTRFFEKVFDEPDFAGIFGIVNALDSKLWDGVRMARDVAKSCDWKAPRKKKPEEPEEDSSDGDITERAHGICRGQVVQIAGMPARSTKSWYNDHSAPRSIRMTNQVDGRAPFMALIPAGHTLYYLDSLNISTWIRLDVRPGAPQMGGVGIVNINL